MKTLAQAVDDRLRQFDCNLILSEMRFLDRQVSADGKQMWATNANDLGGGR